MIRIQSEREFRRGDKEYRILPILLSLPNRDFRLIWNPSM